MPPLISKALYQSPDQTDNWHKDWNGELDF